MKFTSTFQFLTAACLLSGSFTGHLGQTEAKGKEKDTSTTSSQNSLISGLFSTSTSTTTSSRYSGSTSTSCERPGGCVIATGQQVVTGALSLNPSRTAYGHFVFDFDPGFTTMSYSLEVADGQTAPSTFDVQSAELYCAIAGTTETAASKIADLSFNLRGNPVQGSLSKGKLTSPAISCNGVTINTLSALYQAMLDGSVAFISDVNIGGINTFTIRGQIFLPQTKPTTSSS